MINDHVSSRPFFDHFLNKENSIVFSIFNRNWLKLFDFLIQQQYFKCLFSLILGYYCDGRKRLVFHFRNVLLPYHSILDRILHPFEFLVIIKNQKTLILHLIHYLFYLLIFFKFLQRLNFLFRFALWQIFTDKAFLCTFFQLPFFYCPPVLTQTLKCLSSQLFFQFFLVCGFILLFLIYWTPFMLPILVNTYKLFVEKLIEIKRWEILLVPYLRKIIEDKLQTIESDLLGDENTQNISQLRRFSHRLRVINPWHGIGFPIDPNMEPLRFFKLLQLFLLI